MKIRRIAALMGGILLALAVQAAPPHILLWAWETPLDLRALPEDGGVAFLAAHVYLKDGTVAVWPRRQPLRIAPGRHRMAVVRISTYKKTFSLTPAQRAECVRVITDVYKLTRADSLQIDFDAVVSQRAFYAALLNDVRAAVGPKTFLSMTALVSWCRASNTWINPLPVDEVVPMAFGMGLDTVSTEIFLRGGGQFENARCRDSLGMDVTQLNQRKPGYKRVYAFSSDSWTPTLFRPIFERFR